MEGGPLLSRAGRQILLPCLHLVCSSKQSWREHAEKEREREKEREQGMNWLGWLGALLILAAARGAPSEIDNMPVKDWCFRTRNKYNIVPGKSFGSLPQHMVHKYLLAECFRFFCKPHPLAGKGVFECEPLGE